MGEIKSHHIRDITQNHKSFYLSVFPLGIVAASSLLILSFNSMRFHLPLGEAGLFSQMAAEILAKNFSLPDIVHYYGPGPIPFAYPPLGLYLMALFYKTGIHPFTYLRFIPPILSFLALIPVCLMVRSSKGSWFAAGMSVVILASSPELYTLHAQSGGVVRALAFLFLLWAFFIFNRSVNEKRTDLSVLAGALFGLAILTHLLYGWVFVLWAAACMLAQPRLKNWRAGVPALFVGVMISAPWFVVITARHGLDVFKGAVASHGNLNALQSFQSPVTLFAWVGDNTSILFSEPVLAICLGLGLLHLILQRRYAMPLTLLFSLLFISEGARFVITLTAMIAAECTLLVIRSSSTQKILQVAAYSLLVVAAAAGSVQGWTSIIAIGPRLHESTISMGSYFQNQTQPQSKFLFVGFQEEAEWLPYLLQREPLFSKWGSEWLGDYNQQSAWLERINTCENHEDLACVENLIEGTHHPWPDYLITRKGDEKLTSQLEQSSRWSFIKEIGRYLIWMNQERVESVVIKQ